MAAERRLPRPPLRDRRVAPPSQATRKDLEPIRSHLLRVSSLVAPWLALIVIGADLLIDVVEGAFPLSPSQIMFLSGVAAVAVALFVFLELLEQIRDTFQALWSRSVLAPKGEPIEDSPFEGQPERPFTVRTSEQRHLNTTYRAFLEHLQALLNSRLQWVFGVVFTLLIFTWSPGSSVLQALRRFPWYVALPMFPWYILAAVASEAFVAFIVGTFAWRMIVVGIAVWQLGTGTSTFGLKPQLGHPDQCGGLEPLGSLCLWNALIISVAGLYLGTWIIILRPGLPTDPLAVAYVPLFLGLLVIPVVVAAITFFLPLWSVHQTMVTRRAEIRQMLDELGQSIDRVARELIDRADELDLAEGEEKAKKLELMRQTYQQYQDFPVWPFNLPILLKFISSQGVPLLALTGLSEPLREIVKNFLGFMGA